jgi:hypothetical protein
VELPDLIAFFDATRRQSGELDLWRPGEEVRLAAPAGEATELSPRQSRRYPNPPQLAVIGDITRRESLRRSMTSARLRKPSNLSRIDDTLSASVAKISLTTVP